MLSKVSSHKEMRNFVAWLGCFSNKHDLIILGFQVSQPLPKQPPRVSLRRQRLPLRVSQQPQSLRRKVSRVVVWYCQMSRLLRTAPQCFLLFGLGVTKTTAFATKGVTTTAKFAGKGKACSPLKNSFVTAFVLTFSCLLDLHLHSNH